ncbi:MAG: hypothetical protein FIB01_07170 [Gemmatimonadetes bacterium]|nr:hypothetical protein [Gemmatimonadota bacterium]
MLRGTAVVALAAACLLAGCQRQQALPLEQEEFVQVMVALRRAALETPDQSQFDAKKQAILGRARITEDQLRAYARQATRDPRALADAYDSINTRLQRFHEPQ